MQRQEIPNNTPEQVHAYIEAALELVAAIEPPDDLRAVVFEAAFAGISGKQIMFSQPQPLDLGNIGKALGRH